MGGAAAGLAALARRAEADADLLEAREVASGVGPRFLLWRIAAARSRLWRDRDRELAAAEAAVARAELGALAETISDDATRAAFLAAPEVQPWIGQARLRLAGTPRRLGGRARSSG
jgi:hypothetical protein